MIRGKKDGKNFSTWFIGFDHELPVPSSRSCASDKPVSRPSSLENLLSSSTKDQHSHHLEERRSRAADSIGVKPVTETRDIYREAFESARRTEEVKFKTKFDQLLTDLTGALDQQPPSEFDGTYGSTSYGEVMLTFRSRMKELLTGFSQRLQLAYESFDIPHEGECTNQQVRQNVSKMVEGILGESLDLTSDEAVSDLSSLSDDSGGDQNSFEDQIAQAIVSKLLENHRREVSEHLDQPDGRYNGDYNVEDEDDHKSDIVKDFEELREFVRKTQSRPAPVPRDIEEPPCPINEKPIEKVTLDRNKASDDFHIRCSSSGRVHDSEPPLPDFSEFDGIDFDSHEIDPDLLSMNLAIIPEETEEELEDEANDAPDKPWRENWIFKGMVSPYDNLGNRRVGNDEGQPLYMMVPQPGDQFVPQVGNKDADELSDLSDADGERHLADDFSDDENTFYAKTSEELARISRKHSTTSVQTDSSDLDSGSSSKLLSGALPSDPILGRGDIGHAGSNDPKLETMKLLEDFVPADGDDPTFIMPPESVTIAEGEPLRISCRVGGTSAVDVFWYRENSEVEELEDSEDVDIISDNDRHNITMYNLRKNQGGQYMAIALSDQGRCTQYFIVTVTDNKQELKKPEFIKDIQDIEVKECRSVKFRCKVKGYPQPRVTWYKDGKLLKSTKACRIEKFGNRDYILTIDNATLDDDAEYCVVARNIAGETKSTAQVIVESDQLDSYTSSQVLQQQKNEQNISNLSEKVSAARGNITSAAESMLGTAEELSYLNQNLDLVDHEITKLEAKFDEENNNVDDRLGDTSDIEAVEDYRAREKAAKNVRILTSSALNVLRTAEEIIRSEKETGNETFTLDASRSNDTDDKFCNESCSDSIEPSNFVQNVDDDIATMETSATSKNTHDVGEKRERFVQVKEFSFGEAQSDMDFVGKKRTFDEINSPENSEPRYSEPVNFGPGAMESDKYRRDYEVKGDGKKRWEVKLDSFSPRAEIINRKTGVENAEEQIYMTAGNVYSLEERVRDLESRVTSDKGHMSDLEDEVAMTVAHVSQSERQVGTIEHAVNHLRESSEPSSLSPRADSSSQLSSPPLSVDSGVSSVRERPLQTALIGHTSEDDVPESRGEYDADSGIELPSVNRLRAMFSKPKGDDLGDGNFTRIHSITARHVPKEQLERLRRSELSALGSDQPSEWKIPELSPHQTSSSVNFTFTPLKTTPPKTHSIVSRPPLVKTPDLSGPATYTDLEPAKDPVLIYPQRSSPISPNPQTDLIMSSPKQSLHVSTKTMPAAVASNSASIGSVGADRRVRSSTPPHQKDLDVRRASSTHSSSSERPKTPRIRSGAISARAAFWEKRILTGNNSDEEEFPEMVHDSDC